jgi:hypothetical protein
MNATSIFTFDHGQKKLNKAIGISDEYLKDLQGKIGDVLKNYLFDEDRNMKEDASPSQLVEACLHEFSYNQLVIMSSFFLQHKLDQFAKSMDQKLKATVKRISLDSEDLPPHIRQMLLDLTKDGEGETKATALNSENLPQDIIDFLDSIIRESEEEDDDNDN